MTVDKNVKTDLDSYLDFLDALQCALTSYQDFSCCSGHRKTVGFPYHDMALGTPPSATRERMVSVAPAPICAQMTYSHSKAPVVDPRNSSLTDEPVTTRRAVRFSSPEVTMAWSSNPSTLSLSDLSDSAHQAVLLEMAACESYLRDRPVPELPGRVRAKTREEALNGVDVMGDQPGASKGAEGKGKQVVR